MSTITADRPTRRPAALEALANPDYRLIWAAGVCINTSRWMGFLAIGWLVLEITNSPQMVALAAVLRMAPMLVVGPFAGVLCERVSRTRMMVVMQSINVVAALALASIAVSGSLDLWALLIIELVLGVTWAVDWPARRTALYSVVGPGRLANAFSLENMSQQASKMVGPATAGFMLGSIGPIGVYVPLVFLYATSLTAVILLARRLTLPKTPGSGSVFETLASGLRESRRSPILTGTLVITVLANMLVYPYQQFLPVIARDVLEVGPELLGLLVAADGFGALVLGWVIASRRSFRRHAETFTIGALGTSIVVAGLALSPWYALSLAFQFLAGMGEAAFGTMQSTLVLMNATDRSRGRIMGILSFCIGTGPIGTAMLGAVVGILGAPMTVAISSGLATMLIVPWLRRMRTTEDSRH
jgi:MFS family permease